MSRWARHIATVPSTAATIRVAGWGLGRVGAEVIGMSPHPAG
ncbi:hypothetical protein [Nonomuraea jabiensis]